MEENDQDIDGRVTCLHQDAVKWNPYNHVVQCHACGEQFVPVSATDITFRTWPADAVYGFAAWLTARRERSGPFSRYDEAAQAAQLVDEYCKHNGWDVTPGGPQGFSAPEKDRMGWAKTFGEAVQEAQESTVGSDVPLSDERLAVIRAMIALTDVGDAQLSAITELLAEVKRLRGELSEAYALVLDEEHIQR